MATQNIPTLPAQNWHTSGDLESVHKPMQSLRWLGNADVDIIKSTLTPTHGAVNSDRPFQALNTGNFVLNNSAQDMYAAQEAKGVRFSKNNTTQEMAFNVAVKFSGNSGFVIPASLIRSVGIEGYRSTSANSNFRIWNIGLEFRYLRDDSQPNRLYTPGWTTAYNSGVGYDYKCFNGESHFNTINSWGHDWGLQRVIFNMRSNGTSGSQSPQYRVYHIKIGHSTGLGTNYRLVKPANGTWQDHVNRASGGRRYFK